MNRTELKNWAKEKVKGKRWPLLLAIIIGSFLCSISIPLGEGKGNIPIGWVLYFIEVGLTFYLVNFINDKPGKLEDLFSFSKDFGRDLLVNLVQSIFVFLWSLLLIVPGIIKGIAYSLVPMLLMDDQYKDLDVTSVIKKSEEMMNGHKMDYFVLQLSFIGWHLLAILTLGLLEIWIIPYQQVAMTKFLYDVKTSFEGNK